ncbi:MAG: TetR/AcrR family transcriptional regulator [Gemmatimonadota bacterium]|jgi:AcrR family transcriptional regulator|nr:TetR/AcrR family transcriptional regulator [Gemmatimonadota bacterium]
MGIAERREREKEQLRTRIIEAARDIVSEKGLDALSMRAIAERIEYSPATIYLYFKDKDELVREVVVAGFQRMSECMREDLMEAGEGANALQEYRAIGRAYARFALENTAYFRVMFELPTVAQMECPCPESVDGISMKDEKSFDFVVETLREAVDSGLVCVHDPFRGALIGWGMVHGLTSLYLSGHLGDAITSNEEFLELIAEAQRSLYQGWRPREAGEESTARETAAAALS